MRTALLRTPAVGVRPIRMAVLGAADIARRRMLPAMASVPEIEPVVVASRDPDRAAALAGEYGLGAERSYEAVLRRDDLDAVYLPLPNALHFPWAERALEAGLHVLVEKPLTTSRDHTARLQLLAGGRGLVLMEAMMFVCHRQHEQVRALMAGLGTPLAFAAAFTVPPRPGADIRYRPDLGGGALLDTGVYPLRAAQHLLGPDLRVAAAVLRHDRALGVDVGGEALLLSPDGVTAHLEFGLDRPYRCRYEISGTAGRLLLDRAFTPPPGLAPTALLTDPAGAVTKLPLAADDQFAALLRRFARAVRAGRAPAEDVEASLAQARLLHDLREAARRVTV
ncbi:Gfo/Idh/MocA family protein [Nonomuraea zeae]|uniref:Gfo/Idh/MocA family protein n=1 Tax=Nonomuraea zeae TaxID=1642303 RepID=UPI001980B446|nr:Gfo/Idh/MocA family oxidoreductase [Nonomuraea zeae]